MSGSISAKSLSIEILEDNHGSCRKQLDQKPSMLPLVDKLGIRLSTARLWDGVSR